MEVNLEKIDVEGIKIVIKEKGNEIVRAFLYLMHNGQHSEPFGLMEDVFVEEEFRGKGHGKIIVEKVIEEARNRNCYKLICTSRYSKPKVHEMYLSLGFEEQGKEFRINF
jgi:GNAT superfamily N-acetyltransferase